MIILISIIIDINYFERVHESNNSNPDVEMLMIQFDSKCADEQMTNLLKNPEKFNFETKGDQLIDIFMECLLMKTQ